MASTLLMNYLRDNPGQKVLFLAHGTTLLRKQIADLFSFDNQFTAVEITQATESDKLDNAMVHVAIPHSKVIQYFQYGLIIIDEAHQFFHGKMVQTILSNNPNAKHLLLTASHWRYTLTATMPVVCYSQLEMLEAGVIVAPDVVRIKTKQEFRKFTQDYELAVTETLRNVTSVVRKVKVALPRSATKVLVACHNIQAARAVKRVLGKEALLSTVEDDSDNVNFARFQKDDSVRYLVVVYRGIIGLDMPELSAVVDLTATQNIDRMFQLLGRVVRRYPGKQPTYIKLVPAVNAEWYDHLLSATISLAHPDIYNSWNGRLDSIRCVVQKTSADGRARKARGEKQPAKLKPIIPKWSQLRNLFRKGSGKDGIAVANMMDVRAQYGDIKPHGYWTRERVEAVARQFHSANEWKKVDYGSYQASCRLGVAEDIYRELGWAFRVRRYSTEDLMTSAGRYKSLKEWSNNEGGAYNAARKKNLITEICAKLGWSKQRARWSKKDIIDDARGSDSYNGWKEKKLSYQAAQRNGWVDEVCALMGWHKKRDSTHTKKEILDFCEHNGRIPNIKSKNKKERGLAASCATYRSPSSGRKFDARFRQALVDGGWLDLTNSRYNK